jgi:hypothetical protein
MREQPHVGEAGKLLGRDSHQVRVSVADQAGEGADAEAIWSPIIEFAKRP